MEPITWVVTPEEQGLRLDVFLGSKLEALSRSGAAQAIKNQRVWLDNRSAKPGLVLKAGERITYAPTDLQAAQTVAQPLPLEVLYQDQDLAVVVKPVGLVTHPAAGHADGTLVNALLYHLDRLSGIGGEERPGLIHRLDKDTSGLLLVAKHDWAHHQLAAALQERRISRLYQAVAWGSWPQSAVTITANIGRDPKHRKKFTVVNHGGKTATTNITILKQTTWCSWIECRLETGRTHQIRVHCHYLRHPLLGDRLYGKRGEQAALARWGVPRPDHQLLHAHTLSFNHPRSQTKMEFTAPLPSDFQAFLNAAGLE